MESDSSPLASTHDETANLATSKLDNRSHVVNPFDVKPEAEPTNSQLIFLHHITLTKNVPYFTYSTVQQTSGLSAQHSQHILRSTKAQTAACILAILTLTFMGPCIIRIF